MVSFLSMPFGHVHTIILPRPIPVLWAVCIFCLTPSFGHSTYENTTKIFTDKLGPASGYNTAVRPLKDQSQIINVSVSFDIFSIVEIDDIHQKCIINGVVALSWVDEILAWNPTQYNNVYSIIPYPAQIWRPRLVLGNTHDKRDLFEDDYSPTTALFNGRVRWYPGSLFPTSCKMNLKNYPFDQQTCNIDLYSMGISAAQLTFTAFSDVVGMATFVESGEWEILHSSIEVAHGFDLPLFQVKFFLQRRPGFFVINIILPVVLLSFLNIMVFLIPVESGEKISYGITVLLALFVFMSIVSGMLPRSSDTTPLVCLYLMSLIVISVLTVIVAILIVSVHHRDEKETKHHRATERFKGILKTMKSFQTNVTPLQRNASANKEMTCVEELEGAQPPFQPNAMMDVVKKMSLGNLEKTGFSSSEQKIDKHENHYVNNWRIIGRHIDCISFVVFMTIFASVTVGFLVAISS